MFLVITFLHGPVHFTSVLIKADCDKAHRKRGKEGRKKKKKKGRERKCISSVDDPELGKLC
jgi:hypothetical protein